MSFKIEASYSFIKELKRLSKKYPSLKSELDTLGTILAENPSFGTPIGKDCFKIRLAIKSKGKGKSGGARVITCVLFVKNSVILLSIYDKSESEDISEAALNKILKENDLI
jgi:mRNA-degrading endonuclease RelE of RelBE toxin-antitoxin system